MTYPLDIELNEPLEAALEDILSEVEAALDNIRRHTPGQFLHPVDVDIQELLAEHQAIALVWDADMLLSTYPHLTRGQAWEVLRECERQYTAENGLTWDDVAAVVNELFPEQIEARRRAAKLAKVAQIIADYDPNGDERENLVDLLADVLHWCDGCGEPFEEFYGTARIHFAAETNVSGKGA